MVIQIVALNSKHKTNRKQRKHRKATIISFPKEEVEKVDLDKPVFNKIMTTREKRAIQFRSSFNLIELHGVKSVRIRIFQVCIFLHLDWIRRDTPYIFVFSPNTGMYGPEKLQIRRLFTQCLLVLLPSVPKRLRSQVFFNPAFTVKTYGIVKWSYWYALKQH